MGTNYNKQTLGSGFASTAQLQDAEDETSASFADTLSRTASGAESNAMQVDLDMNSNDILNVANLYLTNLVLDGDPVTVLQTEVAVGDLTEVKADIPAEGDVIQYSSGAWVLQSPATSVDVTANYNWTGTHTYTVRPTVNSNVVYDAGNINEAVVPVNTQAGATYTTVLGDAGKLIETTSGSSVSITIPPNSSVAYPVGTVISVLQAGAGQVTLVAGSGVTLNTETGLLIQAQYGFATLIKTATDTWIVTGSLTA